MKPKIILEIEKEFDVVLEQTTIENVMKEKNSFVLNNTITGLNIHSNKIYECSYFKSIISLKKLYIRSEYLDNIFDIRQLINITHLGIGAPCDIDFFVLRNLHKLKYLEIRCNIATNLFVLTKTYQLKHLTLKLGEFNNSIISFLKILHKLTYLDIGGNNLKDITFIRLIYNLQTLILKNNKITDISTLKKLINLNELDISNNKINDISHIKSLSYLKKLDCSNNQIEDVSSLFELRHLDELTINNNSIKHFDYDNLIKSNTQLTKLYLNNNPIYNIPKEILTRKGNILKDIHNYLQSLKDDYVIPNDQIKMLLLGNTKSGKSALIHYLEKGEYKQNQASTHGIEHIIWKPYEITTQASEEEINLKVAVWDFGGQEFYHNTHSLFFSENAIYIVLFEAETNFQGKKETEIFVYENNQKVKKNVLLEHFDYHYWLDNVRHFNQTSVKVLVQNKMDISTPIEISEACKQTYKLNGREHIFYISVAKTFEEDKDYILDFEQFKRSLLKHIKENIATFQNSTKWQTIKNKIQEEWRKDNVLDFEEYVKRCQTIKLTIHDKKDANDKSQLETLTEMLHLQGVILHFKDIPQLKNKVFVNPAWVTDCIYRVLDYNVIYNQGKFTKKHIEEVAKSIGNISADGLMALLRNFKLVFEIERLNQKYFIAPQYLLEKFDEETQITINSFEESNNLQHCFTFSYPDFLPVSVFLKFLAVYGNQHLNYWYNKNELVFSKNGKVVSAKCTRNKEIRQIAIQIQDNDARLTKELFDELYQIDKSSTLEVSVNQQDFVNIQKLDKKRNDRFHEIESSKGKTLQVSDFSTLFDGNPNQMNTGKVERNVAEFQSQLFALLDQKQQYAIADVLIKIENTTYDYDKGLMNTLRGTNPMQFGLMPNEYISSTKLLILSLK